MLSVVKEIEDKKFVVGLRKGCTKIIIIKKKLRHLKTCFMNITENYFINKVSLIESEKVRYNRVFIRRKHFLLFKIIASYSFISMYSNVS